MRVCTRCGRHTAADRCTVDGDETLPLTEVYGGAADPLVGREVEGRAGAWRVDAVLGAGAMGTVYRVTHADGRPAALKVLLGTREDGGTALARFRQEVRATAMLSSPHTARVYEAMLTPEGLPCYAMEYVDGVPLTRLIAEAAPLEPHRAAAIALQIARSLDEAHHAGLIHRDIKPDNVMVASDPGSGRDLVKVVDFGIVGVMDGSELTRARLTRTGLIVGTPLYTSPENARGLELDGRSDLYSVGCVLYEMLTGEPPYQAEQMVSMLLAHASAPVRRPRDVSPGVPAALDALTAQLMAKLPAERPGSAGELMARLAPLSVDQAQDGSTVLLPEGVLLAQHEQRDLHRPDATPAPTSPWVFGLAFGVGGALIALAVLWAVGLLG